MKAGLDTSTTMLAVTTSAPALLLVALLLLLVAIAAAAASVAIGGNDDRDRDRGVEHDEQQQRQPLSVRKVGSFAVESLRSDEQSSSSSSSVLYSLTGDLLSMQELALAEQMIAAKVSKIYISSVKGSGLDQGLTCKTKGNDNDDHGNTYGVHATAIDELDDLYASNTNAREGTMMRVSFTSPHMDDDIGPHFSSFRLLRSQLSSLLALASGFENSRSAPFVHEQNREVAIESDLSLDGIMDGNIDASPDLRSGTRFAPLVYETSIAQYFNIDSCVVCTDTLESWMVMFGKKLDRRMIQSILASPFRRLELSIELRKDTSSIHHREQELEQEVSSIDERDRGNEFASPKRAIYFLKIRSDITHYTAIGEGVDGGGCNGRPREVSSIDNDGNKAQSSNNSNNSNSKRSNYSDRGALSFDRRLVDSRKHRFSAFASLINPFPSPVSSSSSSSSLPLSSTLSVTISEPLPLHYEIYLHTLKYRIINNNNRKTGSNSSNDSSSCSSNGKISSSNSNINNNLHGDWKYVADLPSFRREQPIFGKVTSTYSPHSLRFGSLSWVLEVPSYSTLQYRFVAQRKPLHRDLYAPDGSRGEDILPAIVLGRFLTLCSYNINSSTSSTSSTSSASYCSSSSPAAEIVYVSSSAITLAVFPDFTMPFNVILMVSTVLVFLLGNVFNVLTGDKHYIQPLKSAC